MENTKWKWFLAANAEGRWIVTEGFAIAQIANGRLDATLMFSTDTKPYMTIAGTVDVEGFAEVEGVSLNVDVPNINLRGVYSIENERSGKTIHSIVLSDGWTVIGLSATNGSTVSG